MASQGTVEALLGGLDASVRKAFKSIFEYVLKDYRIGRPGHQMAAENLRMVFVEGMTHATPNTEFSIEHGLETAPYVAIPVLDLQTEGSEIVALQVTQPADARRIYLRSSEAGVTFTLLIEG